MKVIIAGHRDYEDYDELLVAIDNCPFEITEVVSGHALGVGNVGHARCFMRSLRCSQLIGIGSAMVLGRFVMRRWQGMGMR